jgi:uncharacterized protein YjbI with pentapeptide repeats
LQGIALGGDLSGWDLGGQNLTNARLGSSNLEGADLIGANLTNADFYGAALTNANLTGAVVTGANFGGTRNFTKEQLYSTASYQQRNLRGISLAYNGLSNWNLRDQDLTDASFRDSKLAGADLTGAIVTGAKFRSAGLTKEQVYSTASYQQKNLHGVELARIDLTGWDLSGQDLTGASFWQSNLSAANLTGSTVTGVDFYLTTGKGFTSAQLYSTASYKQKNLQRIGLSANDVSDWDFSGQDLTGADFSRSKMTNANFAGAILTGTRFDGNYRSLTREQLYSTASYQRKNLRGVSFVGNDLSGLDLSSQDLSEADLSSAYLGDTNLAGANLMNVSFRQSRVANNTTNLTATDLRGAVDFPSLATVPKNAIRPDGRILGLDLAAGELLVVRDDDGVPDPAPKGWLRPRSPIPIEVQDNFTVSDTGALHLVFASDAWDSLISFESGSPVTLDGTLDLTFASDVDLRSQLGRAIRIFDWSGVTPKGTFAIRSPYAWDLSRLYITGEVTLLTVPEPEAFVLLLCGLCAFSRLSGRTVTYTSRSIPISRRSASRVWPTQSADASLYLCKASI